MLWYSLASFLVALVSVFLLRRCFRIHAQRYANDAPQRFHHGAVPRLGGLGIFLGWLCGVILAVWFDQGLARQAGSFGVYVTITLVVFVVVGIGSAEDYTQKVSPRWRLVLTTLSAAVAIYLMELTVPQLGLSLVDDLWISWPVLGILLALLGLVGLTHAFNLIDGYNGLAGIVAILIGLSYAYVTFKLVDRQLFIMSVCLIAATLGFFDAELPERTDICR